MGRQAIDGSAVGVTAIITVREMRERKRNEKEREASMEEVAERWVVGWDVADR